MIAYLHGFLAHKDIDHVIMDVNGVGYRVYSSRKTLDNLAQSTDKIKLHIESIQREDGTTLYGFLHGQERAWFLRLTSVQGVGSKAALAILSVATPDELYHAIMMENKAIITQADGIGPKLATRIINELKQHPSLKLEKIMGAIIPTLSPAASTGNDALQALLQLGFSHADALHALKAAQNEAGDDATLGTLIKQALKLLQPVSA